MKEQLETLKAMGMDRHLVSSEIREGKFLVNGKPYLNLSSNDYLGISSRLDWQTEFLESLPKTTYLMGATSSRLLTGSSQCKADLEQEIGTAYAKSCLLYNSGYHANLGILPAITQKDDLVLADKLIHASIIDGLRTASCNWLRFRHNDLNHLERLLIQNYAIHKRIIVAVESLYSMDGDWVDLVALVQLKKKYGFEIYLDEAHAVGVVGPTGLGLAEQLGLLPEIDYLVGTLSKALASEGGFVLCNPDAHAYLINTSRSLIFTTAGSPITTLWSLFIFRKMRTMHAERQQLHNISEAFRNQFAHHNNLGSSQIVPLNYTEVSTCLRAVEALRQKGFWVSAIRYPTVPKDQPRIRFSFTPSVTSDDITQIYETLLGTQNEQ